MVKTSETQEREAINANASEKLGAFIQNNRKAVLAVGAGIIALLIGIVAGLSINDFLKSSAVAQVEEFSRRYENLDVNTDNASVNALIEEVSRFAASRSGYAGARAYAILGGIYAERKDWNASEKAWVAGAKAGANTYLAPLCLFNAAVAAEEQGDVQGAIDLYAQSAALRDRFPLAVRAQFQIGRLEESRNNTEAAIQAYRELINRWPDEPFWTNGWTSLAQSRIIALTISR